MTKDRQLIGITGEFLAASKLTELGYTVGMTRKNTPGIDILVSDGEKAKIVQVKTTKGPNAAWVCPSPKTVSKDKVYIFINLNPKDSASPDFHIVPAADVRKGVEAVAKQFVIDHPKADTSKEGVPKFMDPSGKYKDKWELLGLQAAAESE
jgi:hypothetical protein